MPNRTIYVADADLPIFERAQELAGENLPAAIAQALKGDPGGVEYLDI